MGLEFNRDILNHIGNISAIFFSKYTNDKFRDRTNKGITTVLNTDLFIGELDLGGMHLEIVRGKSSQCS